MTAASPPSTAPHRLLSRPEAWPVLLACAFAVSRIAYYSAGFRFDASPLGTYFQYADPELLRSSLLESLWHMHSQPPLFNLFLGAVLKLSPTHHPALFSAVFTALGLVLILAVHALLCRTGVAPWLSALVALAFSLSPVTVLFENWLFYAYPVVVLVALALLALQRYAQAGRRADLIAFLVLAVALALTWSAFHLLWLIAVIAALALTVRGRLPEIAVCGALALSVVGSVYLKNLVLFGTFGCAAVYPKMNLALMTLRRLPDARQHAADGHIAETSLISPYRGKPYDYGLVLDETGVALLDQTRKPEGHSNWHHRAYLEIAELYYRDSLWVLREYPELYLQGVRENVARYFAPATDSPPFRAQDGNPAAEARIVMIANRLFTGRGDEAGSGWLLVIVLPSALVVGGAMLTRRGRSWLGVVDDVPAPSRAVLAFCVGTLVYLFLVTVLLSAGDQSRYRYMVTPCYLVLVGQMASLISRKLRSLSQRRRG